ncbi:MAG: AsmA family protein [Nitrospiraceae bacterium]|nr:AsmA family protein [Nitrospiraceae bacterium]
MKRSIKVLAVASGVLLAGAAGLSLFVGSYLKSDKLKSVLVPRIEQLTGRTVKIDSIQVSLLRGIVVKGFSIKEKSGEGNFLSSRMFVLDFRLLPLLKKEVVIKKLELDSPSVRIERRKDGTYNFSDILNAMNEDGERGMSGETDNKGSNGFTIAADSLHISDAKVEYRDERNDLDVAASGDGDIAITPAHKMSEGLSGTLEIKSAKAAVGGIETDTAGRLDISPQTLAFQLKTQIGEGSVGVSGKVGDYRGSPAVVCNVSLRDIDIGKLVEGAGKRAQPGRKEAEVGGAGKGPAASAIPENTVASGEIKGEDLRYRAYTAKALFMKYRFERGFAKIEPIDMTFSGGEGGAVSGKAHAELAFLVGPESRDVASSVEDSLAGKGTLDLSGIGAGESKITTAIASLTGIKEIRKPRFSPTRFNFTVKDRTCFFDGVLESDRIRLDISGNAGFDKRLSVLADMKISPALISQLSPAAKVATYAKDSNGWVTIPLKITGTTERPSVGLNRAAVGRQVEKEIGKEIKKRVLKGLFK